MRETRLAGKLLLETCQPEVLALTGHCCETERVSLGMIADELKRQPVQSVREESKFANVFARSLVEQRIEKPLFRRPHIKAGRLFGVCAYLFLQGGLLGRAFRLSPVPFVIAFFAPDDRGEEAAADIRKRASEHILPYLERVSTSHELVCAIEMDRRHQQGEWRDWFLRHAMEKMPIDQATMLAWLYEVEGAGFGMEYPDRLGALFRNTYTIETADDWHRACEFGVVDTPELAFLSIEDSELESVKMFKAYCEKSCSDLLQPLALGG